MDNRGKITAALMIAVFLEAIEGTVVSTAIPKIVSDLSGIQHISWVFAAYLLTSAVSIPLYGKLSDLYGRRIVFTIGVFIFLIGSILSGLCQSIWQLIYFRALQGLGAGAIAPTTFTIVGDIYPPEKRASIWSMFGSIWGIAGVLGPLLGGFLTEYYSWRWIFFIHIPFGLISILLIWFLLKEKVTKKASSTLDIWGALTFTIAFSSLLYAMTTVGIVYKWNSNWILGLFSFAIIFLLLFLKIETKVKDPMLPLQLFKNGAIVLCYIAGFIAGAVIIGFNVYLPLWIQGVYGKGAIASGLALMPMLIGWPLGAFMGGRVLKKNGPRITAVFGVTLVLLSNIWLFLIIQKTPYYLLFVIMLLIGLGIGFLMITLLTLIQSSVGFKLRGITTASYLFLRSLGQIIGIAIYGAFFNNLIIQYMTNEGVGSELNMKDFNHLLENKNISTPILETAHSALEYGIHHIFALTTILSVLILLIVVWLPKKIGVPKE